GAFVDLEHAALAIRDDHADAWEGAPQLLCRARRAGAHAREARRAAFRAAEGALLATAPEARRCRGCALQPQRSRTGATAGRGAALRAAEPGRVTGARDLHEHGPGLRRGCRL